MNRIEYKIFEISGCYECFAHFNLKNRSWCGQGKDCNLKIAKLKAAREVLYLSASYEYGFNKVTTAGWK